MQPGYSSLGAIYLYSEEHMKIFDNFWFWLALVSQFDKRGKDIIPLSKPYNTCICSRWMHESHHNLELIHESTLSLCCFLQSRAMFILFLLPFINFLCWNLSLFFFWQQFGGRDKKMAKQTAEGGRKSTFIKDIKYILLLKSSVSSFKKWIC